MKEETINEQVCRIMRNQLISELVTVNNEINNIIMSVVMFGKNEPKMEKLKTIQKRIIDELKGLKND